MNMCTQRVCYINIWYIPPLLIRSGTVAWNSIPTRMLGSGMKGAGRGWGKMEGKGVRIINVLFDLLHPGGLCQ